VRIYLKCLSRRGTPLRAHQTCDSTLTDLGGDDFGVSLTTHWTRVQRGFYIDSRSPRSRRRARAPRSGALLTISSVRTAAPTTATRPSRCCRVASICAASILPNPLAAAALIEADRLAGLGVDVVVHEAPRKTPTPWAQELYSDSLPWCLLLFWHCSLR
jgi:hypothetical protein